MQPDRLIRMANQIAAYFSAYPHEEAVSGVTDHLKQFWEPRMLIAIKDHVAFYPDRVDTIEEQPSS